MNAQLQPFEPASDHLPANPAELIFNDAAFDRLERFAAIMASGRSTIPQHLRGSTGDCFAITMQAMRWRMDPFAVAQKTHLVNGVLGYEAQLVAAVINNQAPITGRLQYEWGGAWEKIIGKTVRKTGKEGKDYIAPAWDHKDEEGLYCKVWATIQGEDTPRDLTLHMAQATTRNSTLWAQDPKQQLAYLATKRWARLYCSDVIMGVYTPDELQEIPERDITDTVEIVEKTPSSRAESAKDKLRAKAAAKPAPDHRAWTRSMLAKLAGATGKDTLAPIRAEIEAYAECPERAEVWEAYKARVNEIKAEFESRQQTETAAETSDTQGTLFDDAPVDQATGEIGVGEVELLKMIDTAADGEELDGVLDLARSANLKPTAYNRVVESATKRRASFNG